NGGLVAGRLPCHLAVQADLRFGWYSGRARRPVRRRRGHGNRLQRGGGRLHARLRPRRTDGRDPREAGGRCGDVEVRDDRPQDRRRPLEPGTYVRTGAGQGAGSGDRPVAARGHAGSPAATRPRGGRVPPSSRRPAARGTGAGWRPWGRRRRTPAVHAWTPGATAAGTSTGPGPRGRSRGPAWTPPGSRGRAWLGRPNHELDTM